MGKIMGIDYGERRIGVALCDPNQIIATGYATIDCRKDPHPLETLAKIAAAEEITAVVVGYPRQKDGTIGEKARAVDEWILRLRELINTPFFRQDERYTSRMAMDSLKERKRRKRRGAFSKNDIDRVAACFILQDFLDRPEEREPI